MDLISVILPLWKPNISQLKKCIDSVLSQTYTNLELIISYKNSKEYDELFFNCIAEYNDKRIKILNCDERGIVPQLNHGILNSKGKLIARIDADDYCELNRFEKQIQHKNEFNCDIVGSWANYVTENDTQILEMKTPISHREIRNKIMLRCPIIHVSVLMEKRIFDEIGLYDSSLPHAEDYELWFRAMSKGYTFGNVPESLVNVRNNPQSITRGQNWRVHRIDSIKAKHRAMTRYGFCKPHDFLYYLQIPLFYFISPKLAQKGRKALKQPIPLVKPNSEVIIKN